MGFNFAGDNPFDSESDRKDVRRWIFFIWFRNGRYRSRFWLYWWWRVPSSCMSFGKDRSACRCHCVFLRLSFAWSASSGQPVWCFSHCSSATMRETNVNRLSKQTSLSLKEENDVCFSIIVWLPAQKRTEYGILDPAKSSASLFH